MASLTDITKFTNIVGLRLPQGRQSTLLAPTSFGNLGLTGALNMAQLEKVTTMCDRISQRIHIDDEALMRSFLHSHGKLERYQYCFRAFKTPSSVSNWKPLEVAIREIKDLAIADMTEIRRIREEEVQTLSVTLLPAYNKIEAKKATPGFHRFFGAVSKEAFCARYTDVNYDVLQSANDELISEVSSLIKNNQSARDKLGYWMWMAMGKPTAENAPYQVKSGISKEEYGFKVFMDLKDTGTAAQKGDPRGYATTKTKLDALERMLRADALNVLQGTADAYSRGLDEGVASLKLALKALPTNFRNKLYKLAWEKYGKGSDDWNFGENAMLGVSHHHVDRADVIREFIDQERKFPFAVEDCKLHEKYGCHFSDDGVATFTLFAPNAKSVALQILSPDGSEVVNTIPMNRDGGDFTIECADIERGETVYNYLIEHANGEKVEKIDPFAAKYLLRGKWPVAESVDDGYEWLDDAWRAQRQDRRDHMPLNILELNPSQYGKTVAGAMFQEVGAFTDSLVRHCKEQNISHVELFGMLAHENDATLGYQMKHSAFTSRLFSSPEDVKAMVDKLHRHGIGVIIDFSANQIVTDPHGLTNFDGTPLYDNDEWIEEYNTSPYGATIVGFESEEMKKAMASYLVNMFQNFGIDGVRFDWTARNYVHDDGEANTRDLAGIKFQQALVQTLEKECPGILIIEENGAINAIDTTGTVDDAEKTSHVKWPLFAKDDKAPVSNGKGQIVEAGLERGFSTMHSLARTNPALLPGHNRFMHGLKDYLHSGYDDHRWKVQNTLGGIISHDNFSIPTLVDQARRTGGAIHQRFCMAMTYLLKPGVLVQHGVNVGSTSGPEPVAMPDDRNESIAALTADMGKVILENPAFWWKEGKTNHIEVVYEHIEHGIIATRWEHGDNELIIIHHMSDNDCRKGRTFESLYKARGKEFEVIFDSNDKKYREPTDDALVDYQEEFKANCEVDAHGNIKYWCLPQSTLVLRRKTS